jgi:hypothetical protein
MGDLPPFACYTHSISLGDPVDYLKGLAVFCCCFFFFFPYVYTTAHSYYLALTADINRPLNIVAKYTGEKTRSTANRFPSTAWLTSAATLLQVFTCLKYPFCRHSSDGICGPGTMADQRVGPSCPCGYLCTSLLQTRTMAIAQGKLRNTKQYKPTDQVPSRIFIVCTQ